MKQTNNNNIASRAIFTAQVICFLVLLAFLFSACTKECPTTRQAHRNTNLSKERKVLVTTPGAAFLAAIDSINNIGQVEISNLSDEKDSVRIVYRLNAK